MWKAMVVDLFDFDGDGEYIATGVVLTRSTCMCIIKNSCYGMYLYHLQ